MRSTSVALALLLLSLTAPQAAAGPVCDLSTAHAVTFEDVAGCTSADLERLAVLSLPASAAADVLVETNVVFVNLDDDLHDHYALHAYATDGVREAVVLLSVVRGPVGDTDATLIVATDGEADRRVDGVLAGSQGVAATTVSVPACAPGVGPAVHPSWTQGGISRDASGVCLRQVL